MRNLATPDSSVVRLYETPLIVKVTEVLLIGALLASTKVVSK